MIEFKQLGFPKPDSPLAAIEISNSDLQIANFRLQIQISDCKFKFQIADCKFKFQI